MTVATENIYTLADLDRWPSVVDQWPAGGVALAVVGRPVGHSLSPAMHNAALGELAKTRPQLAAWRYFKFDIAPEELPAALRSFHENKFRGLNLTVPHKALAVPQLESSDAFVRTAGAANTLSYTATGWHGSNTDGFGLSVALREDLGVDLKGAHVILLGAGGAARGAAVECLQQRCASLWIGNRTQGSLQALLAGLQPLAGSTNLRGFDLAAPPAGLPGGAIVINATSLGLSSGDPAPLNLDKIARPAAVYDMIYRPPQTALLSMAAALGLRHAPGLSMLVHQGARALALWTKTPSPVSIMQAAARAALGTR